MADVSSSPLMPFESIGYSLSGPPIQMEAQGSVLKSAQSAQEALHGMSPSRQMNFEATSSQISNSITAVYEFLLSVKAIF